MNTIKTNVCLIAINLLSVFFVNAQNVFPSSGTTKVGDLTIFSGNTINGEGRLHISGEELLYLLNKSGVVIGKEWGGNGNLTVQGKADVNEVLTLNGPSQLYSPGRMHVSGEELLYLLNKSGVIIGKEWGGNGNLTVQGKADVNEVLTLNGPSQLYSPGRMHVSGEELLYLLNKSGVIIGKEWGGNGNLSVQGNLAVGSVTPVAGYKLQVEEGILAEKVKIALKSTGDWSDYVFAQDYKLKPLSEVETFVIENKHLPGVPSAEELVKGGGINVNEMLARQMEKIEELTLYLIEMKKENNLINKRIEQLEKENKDLKLK